MKSSSDAWRERDSNPRVADRPLDCLTDSVQYPLATRSKRLPVNGILVRTIQSDETQFAICVIAFPNWNRDFAKSCTPPDRPLTMPRTAEGGRPRVGHPDSNKKAPPFPAGPLLKADG